MPLLFAAVRHVAKSRKQDFTDTYDRDVSGLLDAIAHVILADNGRRRERSQNVAVNLVAKDSGKLREALPFSKMKQSLQFVGRR